MAVVNWNALPLDLIPLLADLVLSSDLIDLLCFRAVCRDWRAHSPDPCSLASNFRPRHWIMLSNGDDNLTGPRCFLNLSTSSSLHISLPELNIHSILASTDGLLLLLHEETSIVRLFNPFTRLMVNLPRLRTIREGEQFSAAMASSDDNPKVLLSCEQKHFLLWAKPGDQLWKLKKICTGCRYNPLFKEGRFYTTNSNGNVWSTSLKFNQCILYCPDWQPWDSQVHRSYLVERDSKVLLVCKFTSPGPNGALVEVYETDLVNKRLNLVESLGDHALFVGPMRTLSVSAKNFPSIRRNSIYFETDLLYDLGSHRCELISGETIMVLWPSVRPSTLPDHLIAYCSHSP